MSYARPPTTVRVRSGEVTFAGSHLWPFDTCPDCDKRAEPTPTTDIRDCGPLAIWNNGRGLCLYECAGCDAVFTQEDLFGR